jgi:hypothetical protein
VFSREQRHALLERLPEQKDSDVKFRLVYDGELPPEQRCSAEVKQRIRQQIHPQLKALWAEHPGLSHNLIPEKEGATPEVQRIADNYEKCGFRFVPLVRKANQIACRLELLVLMRQEPHRVFSGDERGDLDNRIKTLIDGLRMPRQCSELGQPRPSPTASEDPFYCLLEDDSSVFEFSVQTDRMLAPCKPEQAQRDVLAVINVHVTTDQRLEMFSLSGGTFAPANHSQPR